MGVLYKLLAEWTGEYSLMFLVEVATQFSKSWDPVSNQTCPFSHALPDLSSKILTRLQPWLLKVTLGLRTHYLVLLINNDNDFEVAHPQSVSSSTWFLVALEFGNVGLLGGGKPRVSGEKPFGRMGSLHETVTRCKTNHLDGWQATQWEFERKGC